MANIILTPNMNLPNPVPGVDTGPDYADNLEQCNNIVDSHNHAPGSGVQINPAGININSDLAMNNHGLTFLSYARFVQQVAALGGASDLNQLYNVLGDLYYNDGSGNQIRITQSGAVSGAAGTITGLPSGTASASFDAISGTFTFLSATSTGATMDTGTLVVRYPGSFPTPSGNYVGIRASASLATGYSLTLPVNTPGASNALLTSDTGGVLSYTNADGSTIVATGGVIGVPAAGITATQLASSAVTTAKIATGAVSAVKLASGVGLLTSVTFTSAGANSWTAPAGVTDVLVTGRGGSGGGGGGGHSGTAPTGGGGGGGATSFTVPLTVVAGTTYTLTVGAKGTGGAGVNSNGSGGDGTAGGNTTFGSLLTFRGAKGGGGGTNAGAVGTAGRGTLSDGGAGGSTTVIPIAGHDSPFGAGGAQSGFTDGSGGGGGGGDGAGGDGGVGTPSTAGSNGTAGGGGGGGGGQIGAPFSGSGGDGTNGSITVTYVVGSPN